MSNDPKAPPAKHNPEEWTIYQVLFSDPRGVLGLGMTEWSALGTSEHQRKTSIVDETPYHITLEYTGGPFVIRGDVSKHQCSLLRMRKTELAAKKAAQASGR